MSTFTRIGDSSELTRSVHLEWLAVIVRNVSAPSENLIAVGVLIIILHFNTGKFWSFLFEQFLPNFSRIQQRRGCVCFVPWYVEISPVSLNADFWDSLKSSLRSRNIFWNTPFIWSPFFILLSTVCIVLDSFISPIILRTVLPISLDSLSSHRRSLC